MNLWEKAVVLAAGNFIAPGDVILDIGSNIGGVALNFSELVGLEGRVICFEANPHLLDAWRTETKQATYQNLELINKAVWSSSGDKLELSLDPSYYKSSSSVVRQNGSLESTTVETIAIDSLDLPRVSLIKLDVEGAEREALIGAKNVIARDRPIIIIECQLPEIDPLYNPLKVLTEWGYEFFSVNSYIEVKKEYGNEPGTFNLLACPNELNISPRLKRKYRLKTLFRPTQINLPTGKFIIDVELVGPGECEGGVGIYDANLNTPLIYYMTNFSALMHSTNSCLPLYLESSARVELRVMQECNHKHLNSYKIFQLSGL